MPPVELTSPVAGLKVGEPYSGPMENWLLAFGYAKDGELTDKVDATGVLAQHDPTLPQNREAPGEPFAVAGEVIEVPEEGNASEVTGANVKPLDRTRTIGGESSPEAQKQAEELDGSVEAEKVEDKVESPVDEGRDKPGAEEPTAEPTTDAGAEDKDAAVKAAENEPAAGQGASGAVEPTV